MFICSGFTAVFVYESAGPTAVYDISVGIEQTVASGKAGMGSTPSRWMKMYWCISFIVSSFIAACPWMLVLSYVYAACVSQVNAWHPGAHVVMMCMQSPRNPAAVRKYWTSGDLKLSFALSTLVIVSLHGATPMRGVRVCDNGESLLFNTSSPSFSLLLFVQVGGSLGSQLWCY